jgi:hypothetical protein
MKTELQVTQGILSENYVSRDPDIICENDVLFDLKNIKEN